MSLVSLILLPAYLIAASDPAGYSYQGEGVCDNTRLLDENVGGCHYTLENCASWCDNTNDCKAFAYGADKCCSVYRPDYDTESIHGDMLNNQYGCYVADTIPKDVDGFEWAGKGECDNTDLVEEWVENECQFTLNLCASNCQKTPGCEAFAYGDNKCCTHYSAKFGLKNVHGDAGYNGYQCWTLAPAAGQGGNCVNPEEDHILHSDENGVFAELNQCHFDIENSCACQAECQQDEWHLSFEWKEGESPNCCCYVTQ